MTTVNNSAEPTIRASVLHALHSYAASVEFDLDGLLDSVGLQPPAAYEPLCLVPLAPVGELLERLSMEMNDDCLGLRMAARMPAGGSGLLGHLCLTAPTAREALVMMAGYVHVFVTDVESGYSEDYRTGLSTCHWRYPDSVPGRRQLNCFTIASVMNRIRDAMGPTWTPLRIDLEHRRLTGCAACHGRGCEDCESLLRRTLGERVQFDQPTNRIIANTASLNRPMSGANPMAHKLHLDHAKRAMSELTFRHAIVERTKTAIRECLQAEAAGLPAIAAAIGLTPRTLQSQLAQAGTNFEDLQAEVRRQIAERLLRETDVPLSEIAYELGYADPSIFSRAAKRWFELSPREYRQKFRLHGQSGSPSSPG